MDSQSTILASRFARVKEYRDEIARLRAENLRLQSEIDAQQKHFAIALMAAVDFALLPEDGLFIIVDGWNIALGDGHRRRTPKMMRSIARRYLKLHPHDFVWIVWDGPDEGGTQSERLRMSWTGGIGKQRADRFICDFLRLANWRGLAKRIRLLSTDRQLLDTAKRIIRRK